LQKELATWTPITGIKGSDMHKVLFYATAAGNQVVKDWIKSFNKEDRNVLGEDLLTDRE
jgi:hypothetical protein